MPPQSSPTGTANDAAAEQTSAPSTVPVNNKRTQHDSANTDTQPAAKKAKTVDTVTLSSSDQSKSDLPASKPSGSDPAALDLDELPLTPARRGVQRDQAIARYGLDITRNTPQTPQSPPAAEQEDLTPNTPRSTGQTPGEPTTLAGLLAQYRDRASVLQQVYHRQKPIVANHRKTLDTHLKIMYDAHDEHETCLASIRVLEEMITHDQMARSYRAA